MATKIIKEYDQYEVTNGAIKWSDSESATPAVPLGCTGSLEVETELKAVIKKCEGMEVKNVPIPQKMTGTFIGHMPVDILRKAYGLRTEGLKKGVWSYGMRSRAGRGIFTWDVFNLEGDQRKMIAFPNGQIGAGFKFKIENGGDEIAEVEMPINFLKDDNKEFYYEAFESEVEDEDIATKWNKNFGLDLITGPEGVEGKTLRGTVADEPIDKEKNKK